MPTLLRRASALEIITALAATYDVAGSRGHVGAPCGRQAPDSWLAKLNPFGAREWRAIYLYMPLQRRWDCFEGESFFAVSPAFRSPCVCQPPPPVGFSAALTAGVTIGLAVPLAALVVGYVWDDIERRGSWLPSRWKDVSWRFRVATGAILHVLDHGIDLYVVVHLFFYERYTYMACAVLILFGYATASAVIASSDSPLRPVAGDVVSLKPAVVSSEGGELADVVAVTVKEDTPPPPTPTSAAAPKRGAKNRSETMEVLNTAAAAVSTAAKAASDLSATASKLHQSIEKRKHASPPPSPPPSPPSTRSSPSSSVSSALHRLNLFITKPIPEDEEVGHDDGLPVHKSYRTLDKFERGLEHDAWKDAVHEHIKERFAWLTQTLTADKSLSVLVPGDPATHATNLGRGRATKDIDESGRAVPRSLGQWGAAGFEQKDVDAFLRLIDDEVAKLRAALPSQVQVGVLPSFKQPASLAMLSPNKFVLWGGNVGNYFRQGGNSNMNSMSNVLGGEQVPRDERPPPSVPPSPGAYHTWPSPPPTLPVLTIPGPTIPGPHHCTVQANALSKSAKYKTVPTLGIITTPAGYKFAGADVKPGAPKPAWARWTNPEHVRMLVRLQYNQNARDLLPKVCSHHRYTETLRPTAREGHPTQSERGGTQSERGPTQSERGPTQSERGATRSLAPSSQRALVPRACVRVASDARDADHACGRARVCAGSAPAQAVRPAQLSRRHVLQLLRRLRPRAVRRGGAV